MSRRTHTDEVRQDEAEVLRLLHCALLVRDAAEAPIADGGVLVADGQVQASGPFAELRRAHPEAVLVDRRRLTALPGFVDAHSHGRGLPREDLDLAAAPLERFLARLPAATPLDAGTDALVAATSLLAAGVTTVQIFYYALTDAESYVSGARGVAEACAAAGIGCELVLGFTDRDEYLPPGITAEDAPHELARELLTVRRLMDHEDFLAAADSLRSLVSDRSSEPHVGVSLGPSAPQWCTEPLLEGIAERANGGVRVHVHLLESAIQARATGDDRPLEILRASNLLSSRLSAAHCVWLDDEAMATLAASQVVAVHNPGSNTRLRSGRAPVREMLDAGVVVGLGLDSDAMTHPPDVFVELRRAMAIATERGRPLSAGEALALGTTGSAAALGCTNVLGTLRPGARADLVLVDTPTVGSEDPLEVLLARRDRRSVAEVWVAGRPVVIDGRPLCAAAAGEAESALRDQLRVDAPARRRRLHAIKAVEPWIFGAWERERGVAWGADAAETVGL